MLAIPMKNGRNTFAPGRVTSTPSGTPTASTIAVTATVISRCCQISVATLPALMFSFCVAVRSRLKAQKTTAAPTTSTSTGWMNSRSRSAGVVAGAPEVAAVRVDGGGSRRVVYPAGGRFRFGPQPGDGVDQRVQRDDARRTAARSGDDRRGMLLGQDRLECVLERRLRADHVERFDGVGQRVACRRRRSRTQLTGRSRSSRTTAQSKSLSASTVARLLDAVVAMHGRMSPQFDVLDPQQTELAQRGAGPDEARRRCRRPGWPGSSAGCRTAAPSTAGPAPRCDRRA